jgi:flagellar biosynthesis/type III secretory pathway protein FliH
VQKWLLDEFTDAVADRPGATQRWNRIAVGDSEEAGTARLEDRFQKESRFADPHGLMANLTQAERALIFELAERDVAREYEERETKLRTELDKELTEARADYEQRLNSWAVDFGNTVSERSNTELAEISKSAAALSVQLAGKITRSLVPLDEQILVRGIQTALFKVSGKHSIRLIAHPDDADWLNANPDIVEKLNISEITADRRLERGGCLLQSGGTEMDATLDGQLEALGEVVREAISTAGSIEKTPVSEDENDPGLE